MINSFSKRSESDIKLQAQISKANNEWMRKFWIIWFVFIASFFFCLFFENTSIGIANWTGNYVPMIDGLIKSPTLIGLLPASYFSLLVFLVPTSSVWIFLGEDVLARSNYGNIMLNRGPIETFFWIYIIGVPFGLAVVYFSYAAPFNFSERSTGFGQNFFYLMLNAKLGLLAFGSVAGLCVSQIIVILLLRLWFPISYLFFKFK